MCQLCVLSVNLV